ncbi:MAG: 2-oxo acid dehydrogenase subunit E2 [Saccharofermentanales bacterium]
MRKGRQINHAYRVRQQPGITSFFPYLSRTRTESVVYFLRRLDVTDALDMVNRKKKEGLKLSLFTLLVTAGARTFEQRPILNRFILGRRLYQRELFDVSYVVKKSLSDDGEELLLTLPIDSSMKAAEVADLMAQKHEELRSKEENGLDRLMRLFGRLPRPLLRFLFSIVRLLDFHGCLPAFIRNELPFYCSVFISNLGSIGVDAPFHHLYELGTTSIFLAFGKPYKETVVRRDGTVQIRKLINLNFTVDERICDGYYLARSFDMFIRYMENPETLL